jgi:hypothetical protein
MYVWRDIEARPCKAMGITYSQCLSVALVIQHAKHVRHIVICGLTRLAIFFHIKSTIFEKKLQNLKK